MKRTFLLSILILMLTVQVSWGQIPEIMNYQGLLTDNGGSIVNDGSYKLSFSLYDMPNGGTVLWSETHSSVIVTNGIFNVILGGNNPLNVSFDKPYWFGIAINNTELTPRMEITSAAYSLNARTVADGAVTTGKLADNAVTAAKIQPNVVSSIDDVTNDGGNIDLVAGSNVTIVPNDAANEITISSTDTTGNDWRLTGNAGTGGSFLGTTDNMPLDLRVNNSRALRLEPHVTSPNIIGGLSGNNVTSGVFGATISGGGFDGHVNSVTDNHGTVGGGHSNQAGNGDGLMDNAPSATVGGGYDNMASGDLSTVGGGYKNTASGGSATASGGASNEASGYISTVGGGYKNIASGEYATVPGGRGNTAMGKYSFAAGLNAKADEHGSFIFADSTNTGPTIFNSAYPGNEFAALCTGGARFVASWNPITGAATGVRLPSGGTSWSSLCDRNIKSNFARVDGRDTLERLKSVPIETWNYKAQDTYIRHIGPMAQDFYAAFGVGEDNKHISTVDADGVALAAIQGLYELVREKDAEIAALESVNTDHQQKITELEKRLKALETLILSASSK